MKTIILLLLSVQLSMGALITADRLITWEGYVGIDGGIPTRSIVAQAITIADSDATIQTKLDATPAGQICTWGAGTYNTTATFTIPSNITVVGAGIGQTILNHTGGDDPIEFGNAAWNGADITGTEFSITVDANKGDTSITVSSTNSVYAGQLVMLDQLNDGTIISDIGSGGTANWVSRDSGERAVGQLNKVVSVASLVVTLETPLYRDYLTADSPEGIAFTPGCVRSGIEGITVYTNDTMSDDAGFLLRGVDECWVKDCEVDFADGWYFDIYTSYRCEVRDSYFHDDWSHLSGNSDGGGALRRKSSGCLIENNVLVRGHVDVMVEWGSSGNVIAYNYARGSYSNATGLPVMLGLNGNHGAHPEFNLFEGNVASKVTFDYTWGTSGHNTVYRNRLFSNDIKVPFETSGGGFTFVGRGTGVLDPANQVQLNQIVQGIMVYEKQLSNNIVGNIIGDDDYTDNDKGVVKVPESRVYQDSYEESYGYVTGAAGSGGDTNAFFTALRHLNRGEVQGFYIDGSVGDTNLINSYYLTSKPAFFGATDWPPFDSTLALSSNPATNLPAGNRYLNEILLGVTNAYPVVTITAPTAPFNETEAVNVVFTGTATDTEDGTLVIDWSSDLDGVMGSGNSYTNNTLSVGVHTITASATDSGNETDTDTVVITIDAATPPSLDAPLNFIFTE